MLQRFNKSLFEVQCHLANEGAAELVVDLVMKSKNCQDIFVEAIELGIALLKGGNSDIQEMLFNKLVQSDKSQDFFKVSSFLFNLIINFSLVLFIEGKGIQYSNCCDLTAYYYTQVFKERLVFNNRFLI